MKFVSTGFIASFAVFAFVNTGFAAGSTATLAPGPLLDLVGKPCKQYAVPQLGGQWTLACEGYKTNSKSKQCARWGLLCEPVSGSKP